MANWHAQTLLKIPDAQVVALVDTVADHTRSFREKYFKDAREYDSFHKMLDRPPAGGLDAVLLVTPHTLHYSQARTALEHGLNVMVEKPMVTSSEHAYDLWRVVKQTGKQLAITFQSPYRPEFGCLARMRDDGSLGKVQVISGWLAQNWLKWTANTWRQDPSLSGGGEMYDSGAHLLNAFMWLMNDPVVEVACFYDACGSKVDINGVAIMRFQNGALGNVGIGGNCPSDFRYGLQIQTDKMLVLTDQYASKLELIGADGRRIYPRIEDDPHPAAGTPHLNFINALLGKEPLRAPVRYGVLLSAMMDALYESAEKKRPVQVKPVPKDISLS